jgi:hypothetical protein
MGKRRKTPIIRNKQGQAVLEYMLMLSVALAVVRNHSLRFGEYFRKKSQPRARAVCPIPRFNSETSVIKINRVSKFFYKPNTTRLRIADILLILN